MTDLEREHLDQRLRQCPDLLASIIESAMDAIVAVGDAQHIVLFNAAAERVFACPRLDPLRNDPRFLELFRKLRFPRRRRVLMETALAERDPFLGSLIRLPRL